ncbi:MAG: TIGR02281 family clan AA aspartic protease [Gammaproteobacteria bacterium]|nr:TIGR02281 family clan AA aspartic protease [Gammaproteobacteria bacterium]
MNEDPHSTKKLGMMFTLGGWILGFLLLGLVFSKILDNRNNPNQSVSTSSTGAYQEVVLQRNPYGHYLFDGEINHKPVTFMIDTGATTTAIPFNLKEYLQLRAGAEFTVSTANGDTSAFTTHIAVLKLGDIVLHDVRASLNPGFNAKEILLGMNVLKHMELIQRGKTLIIRRYL